LCEEEETRRHKTGGREKKKEGETKQESFVVVVLLLLVCGGVSGRAIANRARTQEERDAATADVVVASISSDTATTTRDHQALASFPHCAQPNKKNKTSNHSLLKTFKKRLQLTSFTADTLQTVMGAAIQSGLL
jgi:hypothetical protein